MKKALVLTLLIAILGISGARAAPPPPVSQVMPVLDPQIFISWSAKSLVPDDFPGKALPTANSVITAGVEVISKGKIVNLAGQQVRWYVNNTLAESGAGLQNISFRAPLSFSDTINLRVELPEYPSPFAIKTVDIPVVAPRAVIEAPYPNNRFSKDNFQVKARAYYMDVNNPLDVIFSWLVNGKPPQNSEDPETLNIHLPPNTPNGFTVLLKLNVTSPGSLISVSSKPTQFTFFR